MCLDAGVLRRELHSEALPPLLAATAEYFPSPLSFHPGPEPVCLDASLVPRTVRRLAHSNSKMRGDFFIDRPLNVFVEWR